MRISFRNAPVPFPAASRQTYLFLTCKFLIAVVFLHFLGGKFLYSTLSVGSMISPHVVLFLNDIKRLTFHFGWYVVWLFLLYILYFVYLHWSATGSYCIRYGLVLRMYFSVSLNCAYAKDQGCRSHAWLHLNSITNKWRNIHIIRKSKGKTTDLELKRYWENYVNKRGRVLVKWRAIIGAAVRQMIRRC